MSRSKSHFLAAVNRFASHNSSERTFGCLEGRVLQPAVPRAVDKIVDRILRNVIAGGDDHRFLAAVVKLVPPYARC